MNIDGNIYEIEIIRKNNKNTYIRVRDNRIIVTTNYLASKNRIDKLINDNIDTIRKMINKSKIREEKENDRSFNLFGRVFDIVYDSECKDIEFNDNAIRVKDDRYLNKFLDKYIKSTFYNHLMYWYREYKENIPEPSLKIRKMKTRWGVCNTKTYVITLNKDLYKYDIICLDYVCIHELAHLVYANHSKDFWDIVSEYMPNYKEIRKKLRG